MNKQEEMNVLHKYIRGKDEVNSWGEVQHVGSEMTDSEAWCFWFSIDAKTQSLRQEALNRMLTVLSVKHPDVELHVRYPDFLICTLMLREDPSKKDDSE